VQPALPALLTCYLRENVDKQRGEGVYEASIAALRKLNSFGYGLSLAVLNGAAIRCSGKPLKTSMGWSLGPLEPLSDIDRPEDLSLPGNYRFMPG
jgi:hypothetical protein